MAPIPVRLLSCSVLGFFLSFGQVTTTAGLTGAFSSLIAQSPTGLKAFVETGVAN